MPSEEDALHFFDIFFNDINPYAPVIHRQHFYQQWQLDRQSISPLLLEAVFACSGRLSEDPAQGAQWLALANRRSGSSFDDQTCLLKAGHEEYFLDRPRLSTLQALILLLKARESAPKKGYYYRSWMTCKTIVTMAKDMELHEHLATHESGERCEFDEPECLIRTRIWQTMLICETMIGGSQGKKTLASFPNRLNHTRAI